MRLYVLNHNIHVSWIGEKSRYHWSNELLGNDKCIASLDDRYSYPSPVDLLLLLTPYTDVATSADVFHSVSPEYPQGSIQDMFANATIKYDLQ